MAARTLLRVRDLHCGYGRAEVLHGVSIGADAGQVVTVIGPNGAGKSTLLNALVGALPSRGLVEVEQKPVQRMTMEERVMLGMALVPETRALFATMSVEDNLLLGAWRPVTLGLFGKAGRDKGEGGKAGVARMLGEVFMLFPRLRERRAQLAGTLSGGERQMLAIGRALMGKPRLLMLDEPSLGLAPLVVRDIFATISALRATGVTILLVEQNARAALEVADHGYVLEMGEVVLSGSAADLARDPRIVETYLGTARRKAAPAA